MISDQMKSRLVKAGLAGAILGGVTTVPYGNTAVQGAGYSVPAIVPVFAAEAGASLITDVIHDQFELRDAISQKALDISALAIASGISGAAAVGILKLGVGLPNESILPTFAIAAGAQAGSDYITERFLEDQKTGKLLFF